MGSKYPIYEIHIGPNRSIRYWRSDDNDIHIAVWSYGDCIVTDNDEKLSGFFKDLVKHILKQEGGGLI